MIGPSKARRQARPPQLIELRLDISNSSPILSQRTLCPQLLFFLLEQLKFFVASWSRLQPTKKATCLNSRMSMSW